MVIANVIPFIDLGWVARGGGRIGRSRTNHPEPIGSKPTSLRQNQPKTNQSGTNQSWASAAA